MDVETFVRIERLSGSVAPVDSNPTEPTRPGVLHYLATLHRDGRSFATHVSRGVGEGVDLPQALHAAAQRAHRLEQAGQSREAWLRVAGLVDADDSAETRTGEVDLWYRAQQAEAQSLRQFLGEVSYRSLLQVIAPIPLATAAPESPVTAPRRAGWRRRGPALALVALVVASAARAVLRARRRPSPLRRLLAFA